MTGTRKIYDELLSVENQQKLKNAANYGLQGGKYGLGVGAAYGIISKALHRQASPRHLSTVAIGAGLVTFGITFLEGLYHEVQKSRSIEKEIAKEEKPVQEPLSPKK